MRKRTWVMKITVLLAMLALTASCGSSGGGAAGSGAPATGTFVKTVDIVSNNSNNFPFYNSIPVQTLQQLYYATEIQGAGYMNKISFKRSGDTVLATCPSFTINVGHTNITAVVADYATNVETGQGSLATVINNGTITIPAGVAGEYYDIPFTTPFYYNGVDNLIIEFKRSAVCSAGVPIDVTGTAATARQTNSSDLGTTGLGAYTVLRLAKFHFAGGDNKLDSGGASGNYWPFGTPSSHTQMLYLASEITGTGPITGIGFQAHFLTSGSSYTYTLKLGHTTLSALTTTFASNFNAGTPSTIVTSGSFTLPAGIPAGEYFWVPFPGTFTYNGYDNLIVDFDVTVLTGDQAIRYTTSTAGRRAVGPNGSLTASLGIDDVAYHAKFRFNGGTMDVHPSNVTAGESFPFFGASGARQWLYLASELGTSGTISKLACRNNSGISTAQTYTTYRIVMSHATATVLVATRVTNLPTSVTVFNGTLNMPAGVAVGDYFDIPLTTNFSYNGKDNLVIDVSGTGTGSDFACALDMSAMYAGRRAWHDSEGTATLFVTNGQPVMRFSISK